MTAPHPDDDCAAPLPIPVYSVDDHGVVRRGVRGATARVVMMDLLMPGMGRIEATRVGNEGLDPPTSAV